MFSDAPPWLEETTTSRVWRALVEVNTFTSSGMSAPARVPQLTISDSFHHIPSGSPSISAAEVPKVHAMHSTEVSHTSDVRGASKSISAASR